jgi:hypothetical protein
MWRCGVLPFNFVISLDHCGIFINVDIDTFLGGDPSTLISAALCGIQSTAPKACVKYVTEMEVYLKVHNVYERVKNLSENILIQNLYPSDFILLQKVAFNKVYSTLMALLSSRHKGPHACLMRAIKILLLSSSPLQRGPQACLKVVPIDTES